jgi:hypothetical protein
MLWTVNLAIKHLHTLFPAICSSLMDVELLGDLLWTPVTLQEAFSFVPGDSILGFWHWGIAMVLDNLGIASQLLRMVVVVSYFYYYLFYIQFGWCCDGVSNAKLLQRFCIR